MRELYGFAGNILYIDLNTNEIDSKPLSRSIAEKFIGGMGINGWLAYSLIRRDTAPLSPGNTLIFGVGPLVGTGAPGASRVYATSKSPDGFLCQSSAGHSMGIMLKHAGFDHLVICGCANNPKYLKITDEKVEILDAEYLWGRDTWETTRLIKKIEGDDYWVDCIGPAAENQVWYSNLLCNMRSSFNKTGVGTILGSKKVKAIAVKGTKPIKVADPKKLKRIATQITERLISDPELRHYRDFGSPYFSMPGLPYEEFIERIAKRHYACPGCPVSCKHLIHFKDKDDRLLSYRVSHLAALAWHNRLAGIENWDELVRCVELENRLGIEASVIAGMLHYLLECCSHGILTAEEMGFTPERGGKALRELIKLIVDRKGIGDLAAEGLLRMSDRFKGSEKHAVHIKGIGREHRLESEVSTSTIRSLTNPRGGHGDLTVVPFHTGNTVGVDTETIRDFCRKIGLNGETVDRVCEGPDGYNTGRLTKWVQDYTTAHVSMGICNRPIIMRHIDLNELSELYEAATGIEINPMKLLLAGERVFNVLKTFNVKMGATRRDDMPSRGATWPPDKPIFTNGVDHGSLNLILNHYYDERGWDTESGVPKREKLVVLGLHEIADDRS